MTERCEFAKATLQSNFKRLFHRVGLPWTLEDDSDVAKAVDEIYAEAALAGKREVFGQLEEDRVKEEIRRQREAYGL